MVRTDWYKEFFTGAAVEFWSGIVPEEHTEDEVQLIIDELQLEPKDEVIDIPCGNGRHAVLLAEQGFAVTAVDLSQEFIERAQQRATEYGVTLNIVKSDMAEFVAKSPAKGAYCLGNSFGYLEYDRLQAFLRNVTNSLKSGARFLIDATSSAECLLPSFQDHDWYEMGSMKMLLENSYDPAIGALETHYTFIRDGKEVETRTSLHRVYTAAEIRRMLQAAGLIVVHLLGSTDGEVFELGSPQMYIVAEKI
jgi:ubiquinone/menaquinone biosynthesis C-methylase UbiE